MRTGKRTNAKKQEGSRYSKPKPKGQENVKIIKQVIIKEPEKKVDDNLVYGRNSVMEVLKSDRGIEVIYVSDHSQEGSIQKILGMAKDKKALIK